MRTSANEISDELVDFSGHGAKEKEEE